MSELQAVRIDRWLWAARFFKTRGLAVEAIKKGRVSVNGVRAKPAKQVGVGDWVALTKDRLLWEIEVLELSQRRLSAPLASQLYRESEAGREARLAQSELYQQQANAVRYDHKYGRGRPSKQQRRAMIRVKHGE